MKTITQILLIMVAVYITGELVISFVHWDIFYLIKNIPTVSPPGRFIGLVLYLICVGGSISIMIFNPNIRK